MEESVGRLDRNDLDLSAASESDTALAAAASAVAIIDRSRLRRECLKLALAQHNQHWHIAEFATADELLRIVAASEQFDLVLICAATAEHVDLSQLELVRQVLPETPVVVVAENGNPQRARAILGTGARGFLPASLSLKVLMGALKLVLAGGVSLPCSLIDASARPDRFVGRAAAPPRARGLRGRPGRGRAGRRAHAGVPAGGSGCYRGREARRGAGDDHEGTVPPALAREERGGGRSQGMTY